MIRISIKNACLLLLALFINQLALCQYNNEWFLGKWTNGEDTIVLTKTSFVDSEGDVYPVKYEYHPESGSSIDFLDTDSNEYTGSGGELLGYDVTLDDVNRAIILTEAWHGDWQERFNKKIPENANTETKSSPEKARQLVIYCEPDGEEDIKELKEIVSEFKSLSKDELKESNSPVDSIDLKKTGNLYALSLSLTNSFKRIDDYFMRGFPVKVVKVTIPEGIERIGEWAFKDCPGLTHIDIPSSVTWIGDGAFDGCTGLTSVVIPNSVTYIDEDAFPKTTTIIRK